MSGTRRQTSLAHLLASQWKVSRRSVEGQDLQTPCFDKGLAPQGFTHVAAKSCPQQLYLPPSASLRLKTAPAHRTCRTPRRAVRRTDSTSPQLQQLQAPVRDSRVPGAMWAESGSTGRLPDAWLTASCSARRPQNLLQRCHYSIADVLEAFVTWERLMDRLSLPIYSNVWSNRMVLRVG